MNTDGNRLLRFPPIALVAFLGIAVFIEVASVVESVRQDSWGPMYTSGWLPVVVLASLISVVGKGCWQLLRGRKRH